MIMVIYYYYYFYALVLHSQGLKISKISKYYYYFHYFYQHHHHPYYSQAGVMSPKIGRSVSKNISALKIV